jgi:hypothetical protein
LNVFKNPKTGGSYDFEIIKELEFRKLSNPKKIKIKIKIKMGGCLNSKIKENLESKVIKKI